MRTAVTTAMPVIPRAATGRRRVSEQQVINGMVWSRPEGLRYLRAALALR